MARRGERRRNAERRIVVRREEDGQHLHHGGAWKVAYADFVTALMAFFLLMWLLNATSEQQRRGLADYFSPHATLGTAVSGSGAPFGGKTPFAKGDMVSDLGSVEVVPGPNQPQPRARPDAEASAPGGTDDAPDDPPAPVAVPGPAMQKQAKAPEATVPDHTHPEGRSDASALRPASKAVHPAPAAPTASMAARENAALTKAAQEIRQAVTTDPALAGLGHHLSVEMTPQGLRIQIMDSPKEAMFATGSAVPSEATRALLRRLAPALLRLTEPISIDGYTDAARYRGTDRSNWELSADRANATRRLLMELGVPEARISSVTGHADRDLLVPSDPLAAVNRRVAILVRRTMPAPAPHPAAPAPRG